MRGASAISGFLFGLLAGVLALACFSLGHALWGLPFAPFDTFEWLTRLLPGSLVTAGIDTMVSAIGALDVGPTSVVAKLVEQAIAVTLFALYAGAVGAVLGAAVGASTPRRAVAAAAGFAGITIVITLATVGARGHLSAGVGVWVIAVGVVSGAAFGLLARMRAARPPAGAPSHDRRLVVTAGAVAAGSALIYAASRAVGARRAPAASAAGAAPAPDHLGPTSGPAASPAAGELAARIVPVQGTRPELTPNATFYRIDIDLEPPRIDEGEWRLVIGGAVDRPQALTLEELRAMPSVTQAITLECISNPIGGDLIGTSLWTGVPLRDVLARAGLRDEARAVHVRAADGFYESVPHEDMNDPRTLLVYAMNHARLPRAHGFPLRIYIPNRHGMKQPKWITELVASDHDGPGYWVDRGWSATAVPHTTSVIDAIARRDDAVAVGGIAYAGARGISRVELQVDDGPWREAQLISPALGPLTWVLWRCDVPSLAGRHTFRVRAYDGTGALQTTRISPPHPDGATGLHTRTFEV